jgi:hypothetical protein
MHEAPGFIGCIQVRPPLNDTEVDFLDDLADSGRTLRSTPTGRGNDAVPFARLAWTACIDGCCLRWDGSAATKWMVPTLQFLVDHLLGARGVAREHPRFAGFTFDHVLTGAVVGRAYDDRTTTVVDIADDVAASRVLPTSCETGSALDADNVIVFRPRRA